MIMGGVNMKLMQGIDETENQMKKEKTTQKTEKKENVGNELQNTQKAVRKPQTARGQQKVKNTAMRKKAVIEPDEMSKKQVFSFRAVLTDIAVWKAYAVATGQTVESIGNNAMNEYLKKHKLSGAERVIFDAVKARDSNNSK